MSKIPTYNAILETSEDGITCISWVENPATQIDMICFSDEDKQKYTFAEEDKHMVTSVVMLADTKIYRNNFGFEYYITYDKDTLVQMCEKMLADNTFNDISFEHDGNIIEKGIISLVELYTVDENKKSPFNIPEGSIVATYKVNDESIWELFKSGNIGGISLEGFFAIKEVEKYNKQENKSMLDKIKNTLKELLVEVEAEAVIQVEASEETPEETPEETTEEPQEEIETPETPEEPAEEPQEAFSEEQPEDEEPAEEPAEEPETKKDDEEQAEETVTENDEANKIATLEAKVTEFTAIIEGLVNEIEAIKTKIVEIEVKPAVPAIEEEYEQTPKTDNKWSKLGSLLK